MSWRALLRAARVLARYPARQSGPTRRAAPTPRATSLLARCTNSSAYRLHPIPPPAGPSTCKSDALNLNLLVACCACLRQFSGCLRVATCAAGPAAA
ncbi:hypothetical protein C8R47DRAFT_1328059 [Mycena vitilis]|nr:hypothetical protein C8R47DRAFT_1328052 [Mycena vitilis]KAJ6459152.1 hypothetical protein C8R47DRAFT_1328059 [Mycena vitilis]